MYKPPKNLPYISIEGVGKTQEEKLQSLIEIEMILVMLGYDTDENYSFYGDETHIIAYPDRSYIYIYYRSVGKTFRSNQIEHIVNYVESFNP